MKNSQSSQFETDKWSQFFEMMAEDGHDNTPAVQFGLSRTFDGIDFNEKTVLEIGSGRGLMSIYAALSGAANVTSMEPELAGARSNVMEIQEKRMKILDLKNVHLCSDDFNTWEPGDYKCDIAMMFATVNHLHESPFNARRDPETFLKYKECAEKLKSVLKPGGIGIVTDACRYGFFMWMKNYGIKRPWRKRKSSLNWKIHQNPGTWSLIFREAGFSHVDISYPLPYRLRHLGPLASNRVSNFFLHSGFVAHCFA